MVEPKYRCVTGDAFAALAAEFQYPFNSGMQDWHYEVAKIEDIDKYIATYNASKDDDIRFTLMEMILETSNYGNPEWINSYWPWVKQQLTTRFILHEYTVFYWSCFFNDDIDECFFISPYTRAIWNELR